MELVLLMIAHLLADFFFQSAKLAENKRRGFKFIMLHSAIYLLVFVVFCFAMLTPGYALLTIAIISATHFMIDWIRVVVDSKIKSNKGLFISFIVDQSLHIGILIITYYLFNLALHSNKLYCICSAYLEFNNIVLYCLLFIILLNPTAVFIKKLFAFLFDESKEAPVGNNAGSTIGKLERVITAILLLCNQYGVIGLVLTAKSIARFKQLEEKDFAEKYLIGTLMSLLISLGVTLLIKSIL